VAPEDEHPASDEDRARYSEVLKEMGTRARGAHEYLEVSPPTLATVEYAALQLRMVLELIVMASLATNRVAVEEITAALERKNVDDARKLARNANPHYWPRAVVPTGDASLEGRSAEEVLAEDEWGRAYGKVSELLHARNPFAPPLDVAQAHEYLHDLLPKVRNLLSMHVMLMAGANHLLVGQITDDEVAVISMNREPETEPDAQV
jgi:hypothetical protein